MSLNKIIHQVVDNTDGHTRLVAQFIYCIWCATLVKTTADVPHEHGVNDNLEAMANVGCHGVEIIIVEILTRIA